MKKYFDREHVLFYLFATPFLLGATISAVYEQVWLMPIFLFGLIFASIPFGAFVLFGERQFNDEVAH